jgi:hypothetical protein
MQPVSPVIPGIDVSKEARFGGPEAGQPEYFEVPALVNRRTETTHVCSHPGCGTREVTYVASRYTFTPEEREWIANGADLFVTFLGGMPPHILQIANANPDPNYSAEALAEAVRVKELL